MNNSNINNLVVYLRLTPYQSQMLEHNIDKYNVGRVVKRGGVLYVPYMSRGILGWIKSIFFGVQADLIGPNKVLVRNRRNIRFFKNGYLFCFIFFFPSNPPKSRHFSAGNFHGFFVRTPCTLPKAGI